MYSGECPTVSPTAAMTTSTPRSNYSQSLGAYGTVVVRGTGGGVFALQFLENAEQLYSKLQDVLQIPR